MASLNIHEIPNTASCILLTKKKKKNTGSWGKTNPSNVRFIFHPHIFLIKYLLTIISFCKTQKTHTHTEIIQFNSLSSQRGF